MNERPQMMPPPSGLQTTVDAQGERVPVMQEPVMMCGQQVRLAGNLVQCIRRAGHPVRINFGHTNGYDEWCFDAEGESE